MVLIISSNVIVDIHIYVWAKVAVPTPIPLGAVAAVHICSLCIADVVIARRPSHHHPPFRFRYNGEVASP